MKTLPICLVVNCFLSLSLFGQDIDNLMGNNILRGQVLFLNSGKTPAVGVEISGTVEGGEKANIVFTTNNGSYELIFPNAHDGHRVILKIGNSDRNGTLLEVVNAKEVEICQIPAKATNTFDIIVCEKGSRDLAAQKYYNIIKTSANMALAEAKKEIERLLNESEKDHEKIKVQFERIDKLEKQSDSLTIYKEAYLIASINKDDASKRILRYLQLLDDKKSIQEAREVLSIEEASNELKKGISIIDAAIEELDIRAHASVSIFDYDDAITCFEIIINYLESLRVDPLIISNYSADLAKILFEVGQYSKALEYEQYSFNITKNILNPLHPKLWLSYNSFGNVYTALGLYEKALNYHEKSVSIAEKIFDSMNPDLGKAYNDIAITFRALSNYQEALNFYTKAQKNINNQTISNHFLMASFYNNVAITYKALNEFDSALVYHEKAIQLLEKTPNKNLPTLAIFYSNKGATLGFIGQHDSALVYAQKAIDLFEKKLNPNHPSLAVAYNNLATNYRVLSRYEESLDFQNKAIRIQEYISAADHPNLATFYNNIGLIYYALDSFEYALKYHNKSLNIKKGILNSDHPDLASSYTNIGNTFRALGELEKALNYQLKALRIQEKVFVPNHHQLGLSYWSLAVTYKELELFFEAISTQNKCLKIFRESLPSDHPYQYRALRTWLSIYEAKAINSFVKKDYSNALSEFDTVLVHADESYSSLSEAWNYSGLCYFHLEDYSKAIEAYQNAVIYSPKLKGQEFHNNIGLAYVKNYQFSEAQEAFLEYEKLFPIEGKTYRNWAMFYALQNETEKAISQLQKAINLGYDDWECLKTDDSLDSLRKEKEFKILLRKLKKKQKE